MKILTKLYLSLANICIYILSIAAFLGILASPVICAIIFHWYWALFFLVLSIPLSYIALAPIVLMIDEDDGISLKELWRK